MTLVVLELLKSDKSQIDGRPFRGDSQIKVEWLFFQVRKVPRSVRMEVIATNPIEFTTTKSIDLPRITVSTSTLIVRRFCFI